MRLLQQRLYYEYARAPARNPDPDESEIREYLAGNLCRCSGYEGQLRAIQSFLAWKKAKEASEE